jgi:DNA-binding PadR family transcriptional regulator
VRTLGEFEQLILFSVLQLGDDAFGVAIRENIDDRTGRTVSSGAIYTALGRLEERGYVTSRVGEPVEGRAGRPRKFYKLRPEGARAVRETYTTLQTMAGGLLPKLTELAES